MEGPRDASTLKFIRKMLRHSLSLSSGFILNNQVQDIIAMRYASSELGIDFDGFMACVIRLENLFSKSQFSSASFLFFRDTEHGRPGGERPGSALELGD